MRKLTALIKKEILQIVRDPSAILIALVLPLVLLFIFGYGVNLDTSRVKIGVIMEKSDPDSISLLTAFAGSRYFDLTVSRDRRELEVELAAGRLRGLVVIPADLQSALAGMEEVRLQVITDGSEPNIATFVRGYAEGVVGVWLEHQRTGQARNRTAGPIVPAPRFWYNQELSSRNFLIPGSIAIVMTLIGVLLTALVIAREWDRGTMESLMAAPVSIAQILLGKLIPYFFLAQVSMLMCWAVARFWYEVPFRGSFGALAAVSSVFLTAALGQGLLISSVTKDQYLAAQAALVSGFLPALMLSGFIFEIASMPPAMQGVTYLFAVRYFVSSLSTVFLAGDIWPLFWRSMTAMALIGIFFFILTAKKMVKRVG